MRLISVILLCSFIFSACSAGSPAPQATAAPGSTEIPVPSTPAPTLPGPSPTPAPTQTSAPNPGIATTAPLPTMPPAATEVKMNISSLAFADGQPIPARYTCSGENISPALTFAGIPAAAQSLALIVDDPDAPGGTWVHWVLYNLPPTLPGLDEKQPASASLPGIGSQGPTSFGRPGYGGPCPPAGNPHHYYFKLYALDLAPSLPQGLDKPSLLKQMEGHILSQAQFVGTFQR